jgi:uncharacterized membrane protein
MSNCLEWHNEEEENTMTKSFICDSQGKYNVFTAIIFAGAMLIASAIMGDNANKEGIIMILIAAYIASMNESPTKRCKLKKDKSASNG